MLFVFVESDGNIEGFQSSLLPCRNFCVTPLLKAKVQIYMLIASMQYRCAYKMSVTQLRLRVMEVVAIWNAAIGNEYLWSVSECVGRQFFT